MFVNDQDWFELERLVDKNWHDFSKIGKHNTADDLVEFLDKITHQGTPNQVEDARIAVTTFGRFQPPHLGHQRLFTAMSQQEGQPYVFTTETYDKQNNPLQVSKKAELIQKLFPVPVVVAKNFTDMLSQLNGYYDIVKIFLGDDHRDFEEIAQRYNGRPDKKGNLLYSFSDLEFHFIQKDAISGTLVRERIRTDQSVADLLDKRIAGEVKYLI